MLEAWQQEEEQGASGWEHVWGLEAWPQAGAGSAAAHGKQLSCRQVAQALLLPLLLPRLQQAFW